jgi:hypothetical protein
MYKELLTTSAYDLVYFLEPKDVEGYKERSSCNKQKRRNP